LLKVAVLLIKSRYPLPVFLCANFPDGS